MNLCGEPHTHSLPLSLFFLYSYILFVRFTVKVKLATRPIANQLSNGNNSNNNADDACSTDEEFSRKFPFIFLEFSVVVVYLERETTYCSLP